MHVTNKIMSLVEEKEKHKKNFNRCLNALICPQCGTNLKSKDTGSENLIEIE